MAISTGLALLGGSLLSAGASFLGNKSEKKAIDRATDASLQGTRESNALLERIYGRNEAALAPFQARGNLAGDAVMELLGFNPPPALAPAPQVPQGPQQAALGTYGGMGALGNLGAQGFSVGDSYGGYSAFSPRGARNLGVLAGQQPQFQPPVMAMAQPQGAVTAAQPSAMSAFDRYRQSNGYQFRLNEGLNALGTQYAALGAFDSGPARQAAIRYGQDYGSNEFGKYLGYLTNQQGVGLSGASALAGVAQNYANNAANNINAGADTIGNAALARGGANQRFYGSLANTGGNLLGYLSSSYG